MPWWTRRLPPSVTDTVASKADIADLKAEIANLRAEMFRALWIQGGGIVALIVGLIKFT